MRLPFIVSWPAWRAALLCLTLLRGLLPTAAQTQAPDTTRIRYSEETVPDSVASQKPLGQVYSKLARLQIEEQSLWKLGLNNFDGVISNIDSGQVYRRYGVHLIYERKLRPDLSVMAELSPDFTTYRRASSGPVQRGFSVRSQVAGRFYYNLNQRIRKGKSASNFSANYLSLTIGNGFGRRSHETPFYYYDSSKPIVRADMALLYGLQRRLGRYGFVDFNVGVCTRLVPEIDDFDLAGSFRIGLALGR